MDDDVDTGVSRRPARPPRATPAPARRRGAGWRRPGWLRLPRNRVAAAVVVVTLVAAGLVASLGAGYTVAKPLLGDASTYVGKGSDLAHVNAESGRTDAESPQPVLPGGHTYTPIELPDGSVVAVDDQTGQVVSVDGTTLEPTDVPVTDPDGSVPTYPAPTDEPTGDAPEDSGTPPQIVVAGEVTWYVDLANGRVARFVPGGVKDFVGIDGGIVAAQPGPAGTLVVLTRDEAVVQVTPALGLRRLEVGGTGDGTLTVANGHVYLVTAAGKVLQVDGDAVQTVGVTGVTGTSPTVPTWRGSGRYLLEVDPGAKTLTVIDTVAASTATLTLTGAQGPFGPPAQLGGRAYVPDFGAHRLLVVDLQTGKSLDPVDVTGTSDTFDVWVASDRVWANDQNDRRLVAIDPDGDVTVVDKGTGGGVTDSTQPDEPDDPETPPADDPQNTPANTPPPNAPAPNTPTPTQPTSPTPPPVDPLPPVPAAPTTVVVPAVALGTPYEQACATIQAAQLRCQAVPSERDGDTGAVFAVEPGPGTSLDAGSTVIVSYVGKLKVGTVTGLDQKSACDALEAQGLRCKPVPDDNPVAPKELGQVTAQNPSAGTEASTGDEIAVSVAHVYAVPSLVGDQAATLCQRVERFGATCRQVEGDPGNVNDPAKAAGVVYAQTPERGTTADVKDPVTLTFYSGTSKPVGTYGGQQDAAVAQCNAEGATLGFSCQAAQGDNTTDQTQGNVVYAQDPVPGGTTDAGGVVTLTYHHYVATVPALAVGDTQPNACAQVVAAGLQCNAIPVAAAPTSKNPNPVTGQNPPGGTPVEPNSVVDVTYVQIEGAAELFLWGNADNSVNILRFATDVIDPDYPNSRGSRGWAYPSGFGAVPGGGGLISGFVCGKNSNGCPDGRAANHFYSLLDSFKDWARNGLAYSAPCVAGTTGLWRVWSGNGPSGAFDYSVANNPPGQSPTSADRSEFLGCVWQ